MPMGCLHCLALPLALSASAVALADARSQGHLAMRYCMRVLVLDARARASTGRRRTTDLLPAERPQASERAVVSTATGTPATAM
jgi:hypothetical protein